MSSEMIDYRQKKKLYEALGAKEFKKVVMQVERKKWEVIKKFFPNYLSDYEKRCKKMCKKKLEQIKLREKKQANKGECQDDFELKKQSVINYYRELVLLARREFNHNENRNYHMNVKRPTEILSYLEWNKGVHQNALLHNIAFATLAVGVLGISGQSTLLEAMPFLQILNTTIAETIAIGTISLECLSGLVNWQCINLQNYNISRVQIHKEALAKREAKYLAKKETKCAEATRIINESLANSKDDLAIPTVAELVDRIKTPEQLQQLRELKRMIQGSSHENQDVVIETNKGVKK